ncbi:MAG TPA: HWE histidine kinase domain-containing protein [Caulobacteraceae bacterium]|jgi:two-component sensor histidine kinase
MAPAKSDDDDGEVARLARANAALRHTEAQLEFALWAGKLGSWSLDLRTRRYTFSDYCRVNFGLGPDDPFDTYEDVAARIHPDDREPRHRAIETAIATGADLDVEYRILRPDGRIGWILARGRASFEDGLAVRLAGISLDITDRKEVEGRQQLLLDELNHRVKNTLASVQSIAMQTRRFAAEPADFDATFIARLGALAQAHELLSAAAWDGASLASVIQRTLAPYLYEGEGSRVVFGGPAVRLGPNAAVTLNMAFHELTTNAAKYGALSTPAGRVDIEWREGPGRGVDIDWRERGGPAVEPTRRRGFGTRLIEQGLTHELGGEAQLVFQPQGLWCRLRFPPSAKLGLAA